MPFKPGQSGNIAGKPKGTVSEKTMIWNKIGGWFANEGIERAKQELDKLEGEDYIKNYALLAEYFLPKLARAEIINVVEPVIEFTDFEELTEDYPLQLPETTNPESNGNRED